MGIHIIVDKVHRERGGGGSVHLYNIFCFTNLKVASESFKVNSGTRPEIKGVYLYKYMAVLFWYFVKRDFSSTRYCAVAYTGVTFQQHSHFYLVGLNLTTFVQFTCFFIILYNSETLSNAWARRGTILWFVIHRAGIRWKFRVWTVRHPEEPCTSRIRLC